MGSGALVADSKIKTDKIWYLILFFVIGKNVMFPPPHPGKYTFNCNFFSLKSYNTNNFADELFFPKQEKGHALTEPCSTQLYPASTQR